MSYMRKFSCPMTLKGASSHNSEKPKQSKPWLKPPRKLVTSSFLSGSRSFKPPVARVPRSSTASRASTASRSPAAVVTAPSTMAKRCRAAAKQAAEADDGDDDESVCTEADASLRAAVAADVATIERDEFEADAYADEVDYSDVRLGDVEEDAARARKRAKVAPPADDDASSVGGDTALASESGDTVVDADGDGAEDFALGVETLRSVEPAKVDAKKGVRYLPTPAVADDAAPAHFLGGRRVVPRARGPGGMGIDHYPTIVAAPMDFGTVKAKLAAGAYGPPAFGDAAPCSQAMTFNAEATEPVHAAAAWLYDKFEARADALADVSTTTTTRGGGDHETSAAAAKHKPRGTRRCATCSYTSSGAGAASTGW
ncbi:hypothetical protein SO694_00048060 [Aureococcus anophagefferens]|uniref:Bromo domain-containing protein n=1 Tax=Aureococcus anophagefferens TaxID=44056 RepID=A0ABR1G8K5_AURAN